MHSGCKVHFHASLSHSPFLLFSELGAGRVEGGKEGRRRKKSYFMISKNYIINMVDFRQMHSHYAGPVTPGR